MIDCFVLVRRLCEKSDSVVVDVVEGPEHSVCNGEVVLALNGA